MWWWLACRPDPHVPLYGGWPLWVDPDPAQDVDLGHRPARVGARPAGPLGFEEEASARGLGAAVGGGNDHGVGVALVDLDEDGAPDLVVANGRSNVAEASWPSELWWNDGAGRFTEGSLDLTGDLFSVAAGDVDNDGDVDLYFGGQPTNVLLLNGGARTFTDVSAETGAAGPPSDPEAAQSGSSKIVSIGDIDRDGWLDLVSATSTMPDPGIAVLRNEGGTFRDVTPTSGAEIHPDGNPCAVMFTDYDNDGWRDLWIWNDRGGHQLLHNVDGVFEALRNRPDLVNISHPMGIDAADLDHDGDLDYLVSNIGEHPLLMNQGDGTFEERSAQWGVAADYGWGLGFEDFDLDGWADLYVTQEDTRPTRLYRNVDGEAFDPSSIAVAAPLDNQLAHNVAAAFGDIDGDGLVDAVWARTDGSPVGLHHNVTVSGGRGWLEVRIRAGTGENGGIGARVVVVTEDAVQFEDITGGASRASQSALSARFGLGDWDGAERVIVAWPDGRSVSYRQVPGNTALLVEE